VCYFQHIFKNSTISKVLEKYNYRIDAMRKVHLPMNVIGQINEINLIPYSERCHLEGIKIVFEPSHACSERKRGANSGQTDTTIWVELCEAIGRIGEKCVFCFYLI
jgi:hypothetical protein